MPVMIGGGEFIINGAERVVVSQLHRSPGVDFVVEIESGDKKLHGCRVIPEHGSWIELQVTKKDTLGVRIDQSGKFSSMTLLRAMDPGIFERRGYPSGFLRSRRNRLGRAQRPPSSMPGSPAAMSSTPMTGEVLIDSGTTISRSCQSLPTPGRWGRSWRSRRTATRLILQSLQEDPTTDHEVASIKIYQRLRPGNPPQLEKAKELFKEKFQDPNRYRLGKVGRFRINRKYNQDIPETEMTLRAIFFLNAVRYSCSSATAPARSMTSITWAIAACARSTNWQPTNSQGLPEIPPHVQERMCLRRKT